MSYYKKGLTEQGETKRLAEIRRRADNVWFGLMMAGALLLLLPLILLGV